MLIGNDFLKIPQDKSLKQLDIADKEKMVYCVPASLCHMIEYSDEI